MVPNHMGIDSPWVIEHPDWFVSRWDSPYPAYSFNGPDLSHDGRVEIKIEDHYYEQTDAAVVFRRRDKWTGEIRYIYHGNDGTSFPWNDTAQLDYLNAAVREQVIQTILHVARLFPVIRFDAAMTLAKRHFHRLWFPGPGASGAIPSRAEYGMSQADFDRAMPQEFWREVVDRVAAEVPGTLLLAEAFWLMEGYFVRTLGMHRVYNSAFMNMLRDEENAKYRSVIKNTLEFDPDIMKRYVNFMSNPDERTAIDQFGKGDKCFGVAVLLSTLPGLPMFGHGQIEGFTEKYGMEYRWPRYEEDPDPSLVERHDREIAPILKRRWLFAESAHFLLYDFFTGSGAVDENVFAYSNRNGGECALVVYNNRYGSTLGAIDFSVAYADKSSGQVRQRRLAEGLGLSGDRNLIVAWRDSLTGLEFLRSAADLLDRGLTLDLHAYQSHVYLDFRELHPTALHPWDRLSDWLNGRGVPNLEDELINLELRPVHESLRLLLDPAFVRRCADLAEQPRTVTLEATSTHETERTEFLQQAWQFGEALLSAAQTAYVERLHIENQPALSRSPAEPASQWSAFSHSLRTAMRLSSIESLFPEPWTAAARRVLPSASPQLAATAMWGPVLAWCALELISGSIDSTNPPRVALDLFDRLRLRAPLAHAFAALGFEGEEAWRAAARIKILLLVRSNAGAGAAGPEQVAPDSSPAVAAVSTQQPDNLEPNQLAPGDPGRPHLGTGEAKVVQASPDVLNLASKTRKRTSATWPNLQFPPSLWSDPDICWLTGAHQAEGRTYFNRERYEELLWWLLMPSLMHLAGESAPITADAAQLNAAINTALDAAEAAGYRVDVLTGAAPNIDPTIPSESSLEEQTEATNAATALKRK